MKFFVISLAIFLSSLFSAFADWETYQGDLQNRGIAKGIGYLGSRDFVNVTIYNEGTNKQPLIADINKDGKNEIIIFSSNYLKIFNSDLNLIEEKFVGKLQGQPIIFNIDDDEFKEIVFISNISAMPYFFAYEFNQNFKQEFNFSIANSAVGSGVKCTLMADTKICVFMDNSQYVHIVNLSSKTDSSYYTSPYNDTKEKIPSIADLHNDNSLEAVFWFDANKNNQYGLMAFNLANRSIDSNFNGNGTVDDIMVPHGVNNKKFILKGHPVLVDLNNDKKFEVAVSIFYDDTLYSSYYSYWFTELFVFADNGSALFRKCAEGLSKGYCDRGSTELGDIEGTHPFVLDSNNDSMQEICFIKDKKWYGNFKNMTINCYNYSGGISHDAELSLVTNTVENAIVADINNDGLMEILTENRIYSMDGKVIFYYGFGLNFAVPSDIDGNNALDIMLSKDGKTTIYLDKANSLEVKNVSILPKIPSQEDALTCSWAVNGSGAVNANVNWHKNNVIYSTELKSDCIDSNACYSKKEIFPSETSKNDKWKCSVSANNKSYSSNILFTEKQILGKKSEWIESCNAPNSLCVQSGKGYFNNEVIKNISAVHGMEFEPLTADINNDRKNEIIIFSGSKLLLFNHTFGLIAENDIGYLNGQPTIFNIDNDEKMEIIFIANISSKAHLMAYEYASNFSKQCNITLSNNAIGAGIRCADLNNTKSCFFKDNKNIFYNFNMELCKQTANLTTNNITDTLPTVPTLLDYDNDGKTEAMWWFDNNSNKYPGIAIIEIETMSFDTNFNDIGFIDDVTKGSGYDYVGTFETLKGNPIFYQNDNAGSYEILVSYNNEKSATRGGSICYNSVLKTYDSDGTLIWANTPAPCEFFGISHCDISTPIILDADKDSYKDICFIMKGDEECYPGILNDYIYCINRFGKNLEGYPKNTPDVKRYGSFPVQYNTPLYAADMDNDNEEEIIGPGYIWKLNGTILKGNYTHFDEFAPVPVDVDKDGILELLGTKKGATYIFQPNIDLCKGTVQVYSKDSDSNPVGYANIYSENILKGNTDSLGLFELQGSNICGKKSAYSLKCMNSTKTCETKTASFDFDNDFDFLEFDCTVCTGNQDLKISLYSINISEGKVTINVTSENVAAIGINLTVKTQDEETGLILNENSILFDANLEDKFVKRAIPINLGNAEYLHVYADATNKVNEPKANNYVAVPLLKNKIKAYLNIDTGNLYVDNAIYDYLSNFVVPSSQSDSLITVAVGVRNSNALVNNKSSMTRERYGWYSDRNSVYFSNKQIGAMPYTALVGAFKMPPDYGGKINIFVIGKEIEGTIAAVKRLANARSQFLQLYFPEYVFSKTSIIDDNDILGISVFDIMHNDENKNSYMEQKSPEFKEVVENILTDNNFEVSIKTVKTYNDNTTLRLKNVNSGFSERYKDALSNDSKPIVFSGGLWNNLFYWEKNGDNLINKLLNDGRDLWEIEIIGGPEQDGKSNSPDYNYNDLRDYYWTALIAGVQTYSGQDSLQYVGHSNGCGVALASINQYQVSGKKNAGYFFDTPRGTYQLMNLTNNAIDTFAGEGCPGALDGYSPFYEYFGMFGDRIISQIKSEHVTAEEVSQKLLGLCKSELDVDEQQYCILAANGLNKVEGDFKVSKNLLLSYLQNIQDTENEPQVNQDLSINKFKLYSNVDFSSSQQLGIIVALGGGRFDKTNLKHDLVVSQQDSQQISDRITSTNNVKLINYSNFYHGDIEDDNFIKEVEVFLNG
ncbi:hypothetical protein HYX01_01475 [Candidatus Woesearchaeota archaeon]|nr:hypothetical protein [Candidatus Woesearchaeota archaeon]